jgi:preprotein translocase subunit SecE
LGVRFPLPLPPKRAEPDGRERGKKAKRTGPRVRNHPAGFFAKSGECPAAAWVASDAGSAAKDFQQVKAMATNSQIETVNTSADKAKLAAAALLLLGGIVAFYSLGRLDLWIRVVALLVLIALAVGAFFTSESGKQLIGFGKESVKEVKKVVWPTRKEALQNTAMVFAFVFLMAFFLWVTDKTLEFVLYDLILGWKR